MDGFLEDVAATSASSSAAGHCSDCRNVVNDMKQMREQMSFLTHQIVQLMQVLCINNCRCSSCQSFIGSSKFFTKNHVNSDSTVGNGTLLEQEEEGEIKSAHSYHHNHHHHHHRHHENGYGPPNGGPIVGRCGGGRKRNVVGLDQLLPKLLAERVSGDSYPLVEVVGRDHRLDEDEEDDDDEMPPKGGSLPMRTVSRSSSADADVDGTAADENNSVNNVCDSFDDDDKMDEGSEEVGRAWLLHKRPRFSADDVDGTAGSRSTGSMSAVDRSCFLNESPCSSGSLELPKTSADTIGSNDLVGGEDQSAATMAAINHHERSHHYGYATTNVAALSTGLPLVMPGPKATTFFCTICNREFSNVYYKRHMIVHANSRPYVCDVCGKRFNERSNMMKHKQRLHGP